MKKMKVVSIILAALMIIGNVNVFAENIYTGTKKPDMTGSAMSAESVPGFSGKDVSDYVYAVTGVAADGDNNGVNIASSTNGRANITTEIQFLLPNNSTTLSINGHFWTTASGTGSTDRKTISGLLEISTSGLSTKTPTESTVEIEGHAPIIETNKWYSLAINIPGGGEKSLPVYLNGDHVATIKTTSTIYGIRARMPVGPKVAKDTVYIDDVHTYKVTSDTTEYVFSSAESTPSSVTSVTDGKVEGNVITVKNGLTVGELKTSVATTDGSDDAVRVYSDSDMKTEALDTLSANGTTLVVEAKNGKTDGQAYSYYTVEEEELDADVLKGNNTSDINVFDKTYSKIELESSVYGKASDDSVYKFTNKDKAAYVDCQCFHNSNTHSLIEFGFARENKDDNFYMLMRYYSVSAGSATSAPAMYFNENGIMWNGKVNLYDNPFEIGKWYTIAIQFPTNGEKNIIIYVNGEKAYEGNLFDNGAYGLNRVRFYIEQNKTFYIDNVRNAQEEYTPARDAKASISVSNGVIKDGKLKMLSADADKITLGSNDTLRMYKNDWAVAATLSDADFVVVAAKNDRTTERTYTYLDKEIVSSIIDYKKNATSLDTKLMANVESTLIIAWYNSNKEFVELQTQKASLADDIYISEKNIDFNSSYSYKIFAWNSVEGLYPIAQSVDVK